MPGKEGLGPGGVPYLKEELCALFHDLLDLEEARRVHEQELVPHGHAEAARVAEGQDLLETLGLHRRGQLHHQGALDTLVISTITAAAATTASAATAAAAAEKVPEIRAAGCQHSAMGLGDKEEDEVREAWHFCFHQLSVDSRDLGVVFCIYGEWELTKTEADTLIYFKCSKNNIYIAG